MSRTKCVGRAKEFGVYLAPIQPQAQARNSAGLNKSDSKLDVVALEMKP